ncbi:hypothetical protein QAD02_003663 [Eretmocerus hayati]|uniref:Uncharacterized protein n=1 Tax=Eretmocerus hayati TaxID=131215 RepID=A0ACC2NMT4_9HYME|nr:hypothetical protein QAD02_003663 [Eretmocerus hayati]
MDNDDRKNQENDHASSQNSPNQVQSKKTYADTIEYSKLPKKDQGILIESIEGLSLEDYVDGLEEITEVKNIGFIPKITDSAICFTCKQPGHITKSCPQNQNNDNSQNELDHTGTKQTSSNNNVTGVSATRVDQVDRPLSQIAVPPKRPRSSASESTIAESTPSNQNSMEMDIPSEDDKKTNDEQWQEVEPARKSAAKRIKTDVLGSGSTSAEEKKRVAETALALSPAKEIIEGKSNGNISFVQFIEVINSGKNLKPVLDSLKVSNCTKRITDIVDEVYPLLSDKSMKTRLTKLKHKLQKLEFGSPTYAAVEESEHENGDTDSEITTQATA